MGSVTKLNIVQRIAVEGGPGRDRGPQANTAYVRRHRHVQAEGSFEVRNFGLSRFRGETRNVDCLTFEIRSCLWHDEIMTEGVSGMNGFSAGDHRSECCNPSLDQ